MGEKIAKTSTNRVQILGLSIFSGDRFQVLKIVQDWLTMKASGLKWIATVNPEFVMKALKEPNFKKILNKMTDLNVADGIGMIWGREIVGRQHKLWRGLVVGIRVLQGKYYNQVVSGADLMVDLCSLAAKKGYRVFFLGGWGDRAMKTGKNLKFRISNLKWECSPGKPKITNDEVLKIIRGFKPEIVLVAYGMGVQEEWINDNLQALNRIGVRVVMGVGRSFDYYSGVLPRAPLWLRRMGFEWLYSLIMEPKRWRRQVSLIGFVKEVTNA